jgi:hypothetical protein
MGGGDAQRQFGVAVAYENRVGVLGVWSVRSDGRSYGDEVLSLLNHHAAWIGTGDVVVADDFNLDAHGDRERPHGAKLLADLVDRLGELGLVSAYHAWTSGRRRGGRPQVAATLECIVVSGQLVSSAPTVESVRPPAPTALAETGPRGGEHSGRGSRSACTVGSPIMRERSGRARAGCHHRGHASPGAPLAERRRPTAPEPRRRAVPGMGGSPSRSTILGPTTSRVCGD